MLHAYSELDRDVAATNQPPPSDLTARMEPRAAKLMAEESAKTPAQRKRERAEVGAALREMRERRYREHAADAFRCGDRAASFWFATEAAKLRRSQGIAARPPARRRGSGRPAARRTVARSSASSGDSGSGGSDPPPLPPAVREAAQRVLDRAAHRLLVEASS